MKRSHVEENGKSSNSAAPAQEKKIKGFGEEGESTKERNGDFEKSERDGGDGNRSQSLTPKQQQLTPLAEKSGRFFFFFFKSFWAIFLEIHELGSEEFGCFLDFRSFNKLLAIADVHGELAWWASSDGV